MPWRGQLPQPEVHARLAGLEQTPRPRGAALFCGPYEGLFICADRHPGLRQFHCQPLSNPGYPLMRGGGQPVEGKCTCLSVCPSVCVSVTLLLFGEDPVTLRGQPSLSHASEASDLALPRALATQLMLLTLAAVAVATGVEAASSTMPRRRSVPVAAVVTAPVATSADD